MSPQPSGVARCREGRDVVAEKEAVPMVAVMEATKEVADFVQRYKTSTEFEDKV